MALGWYAANGYVTTPSAITRARTLLVLPRGPGSAPKKTGIHLSSKCGRKVYWSVSLMDWAMGTSLIALHKPRDSMWRAIMISRSTKFFVVWAAHAELLAAWSWH